MFAEDPAHPDKINAWAARMGLPKQVCLDLVNPGFKDPFDTRKVCVHRCFVSHVLRGDARIGDHERYRYALRRGLRKPSQWQ